MATMILQLLLLASSACLLVAAQPATLTAEDVLNKRVTRIEALSQFQHFPTYTQPGVFHHIVKQTDKLKDAALVSRHLLKNEACGAFVGGNYKTMHKERFGLLHEASMPKAMEKFMRALGYDIVATCKMELPVLAKKADQMLKRDDLELLKKFESADAQLFSDKFATQSTDIVRVASKLLDLMAEAPLTSEPDFQLQPQSLELMKQMSARCRGSYSPIATWFQSTLLTLINLGYDYPMGAELTPGAPSGLNSNPSVRRWLNLMFTCHALSYASLFKEPVYEQMNHNLRDFTSPKMDVPRLDQDTAAQQVKELVKASSIEADRIVDQIYKDMVADSLSLRDGFSKSGRKFWLGYLKMLNDKLA